MSASLAQRQELARFGASVVASRGCACHAGRVDEGAIRRCLGDIEWSPEIPSPAGTVAILRTRVEAAGADVDEVDHYVIRHGGQVRRTTDRHRHGWDGNFGARIDGVEFYVVPRSALPPEWLSATRR